MLTFAKSIKRYNSYHVYNYGLHIGAVRKDEQWTVRGNKITWSAWYRSCYIGHASTRKAAAEMLLKPRH